MDFRKLLFFFLFTAFVLPLFAQEARNSELFIALKKADSLVFEQGFNKCDLATLQQVIHQDLEFLHDQNGAQDRAAFLKGFEQSICSNPDVKPIRKLVESSLEVYPMRNQGKLYGAIQMGTHEFFISEPGKPLRYTAKGKFIHTWMLENGEWKLKRILSYDHQ